MNLTEVRKTVSRIKAQLFKNSNSYSIGMLKSHFRGSGLQFKEHRIYEAGDDVRFIDWKMLAKTNKPYLKTFEEERNVEISVVLDIAPTMFYGYEAVSKLQVAIEICCLLNILAAETNDFIHPIIIADKIYDLPKANGEKGIVNLIAFLEGRGVLTETGSINLAYPSKDKYNNSSDNLLKYIRKNREVVVLSDLYNLIDTKSFKQILNSKRAHCFRITSPIDREEIESYYLSSRLGKNSMSGYVSLSSIDDIKKYPKKIKTLQADDQYLESFVKEML
ncbi:MAG: DUF58 domain-containing protein [Oligoflexia bacterium]|nr:DUF58 domain-containing protein [Oligoflexia bacterium]